VPWTWPGCADRRSSDWPNHAIRVNDEQVTRPPTGRRNPGSAEPSDDDELLQSLYQRHAEPLLMFVLWLTGGERQWAEDIVQETLLRAWRNAHKLGAQPEASWRPWLLSVAGRIAVEDSGSELGLGPIADDSDIEEPSADDDTERVLGSVALTGALRTLSAAHQEILVETYLRDRTIAEVADALGLPLGTAKSRLYYGLRALREALEDKGLAR
jgi:RNA polymerase sigma-70 factor, ECF subfamily